MSRIEKIQRMLGDEPDDVFLNFALAMEFAKLERFTDSLAQFDRVLQIDPGYVVAFFHKAKTLAAMGDADAAKEVLTAGIDKATEVGDTHAKLEMTEYRAIL